MASGNHIEHRRVQRLDELAAETASVAPGNGRLERGKTRNGQVNPRANGKIVDTVGTEPCPRQIVDIHIQPRAASFAQLRADHDRAALGGATVAR